MAQEFKFLGYMDNEAVEFFKEHSFEEPHPNVDGVVGTFVNLKDGKVHLPYRGEIFIKNEDGTIELKTK